MSPKKFQKPKIKYRPDEIRGDFGVPPYIKKEDVETGNYKPDSEKDVRTYYAPADRERIDNVVDTLAKVENEWDDIDKRLISNIQNVEVPYDPNDYPQLYDAHHCHRCGNPDAPNILTGNDLMNYHEFQMKDQEDYLSFTNDRNVYKDPNAILADREKWAKAQATSMAQAVLNQILIWILSWVYKLFRPLKHVPFAKAIPNGIKKAILDLKSKFGVHQSYDRLYRDAAEESNEGDVADEIDAQGASVQDVVEGPIRCFRHYETINTTGMDLVRDKDPRGAADIDTWKSHRQSKLVLDEYKELFSYGVATPYETESNTFNHGPINDEYRPNPGERRLEDFETEPGLWEITLDEFSEYNQKARRMLDEVYSSEEVVCCFIYNLTTMLEVNGIPTNDSFIEEAMEKLAILQAILEMYLVLTQNDYKRDLEEFTNLVLTLVNGLIHKIIGLYIQILTGYFRDGLYFWLDGVRKIKGKYAGLRECLPWEEFLNLVPSLFRDLLSRFNSYLKSMWFNMGETTRKASDNIVLSDRIRKLYYFINLLNQMTSYMKFWLECTESTEEDIEQKAEKESTIFNKARAQSNNRSAFAVNRGPGSLGNVDKENHQDFINEFRKKAEPERSDVFGYDGMKVLLTNFVGVSPDIVERVLSKDERGDLCCKGGFRPDELKEIEELFNEHIQ